MKVRKIITTVVCIVIIFLLSAGLGKWLWETRNIAEEKEPEKVMTKVRVIELEEMPFSIFVNSSGKVEPTKKTQVAAEVTGKMKKVTEMLEVGVMIPKGKVIVEIDDADFVTALANATASKANTSAAIADANMLLIQEQAKADQNIREWKRLGKGSPSALVARLPQLESAKAAIIAAKASEVQADEMIIKARRDIEKTRILAPFDLIVDRKFAEEGNFAMTGSPLLEGHSAGDLQVRLPIALNDYLLIKDKQKPIKLSAKLGGSILEWDATFVRSENVVNQSTLTLPIIAKIQENVEQGEFKLPPIGLFVDAIIHANEKDNAKVLPRSALQSEDKVFIIDDESKLRIRPVKVEFTNDESAVISGIEEGERVVTSPLEVPVEGMLVEVVSESKKDDLEE